MSEYRINQITNQAGTAGPQVAGITTFSSSSGLVMPSGTTEYRGGRGRGIYAGGRSVPTSTTVNTIDYITIATLGNALDFGDLKTTSLNSSAGNASSSVRGLLKLGYDGTNFINTIEYITIASTGSSFDFGDANTSSVSSSISNSTRGIFAGGYAVSPAPTIKIQTISYVTIATLGDASYFGDLAQVRGSMGACASPIKGIVAGGRDNINPSPRNSNIIESITIASTGNAIDFGDLTVNRYNCFGCSNSIRGVFGGGQNTNPGSAFSYTIDYITITNNGSAVYFGDLVNFSSPQASNSGNSVSSAIRGVFMGGYTSPYDAQMQFITFSTLGNATNFGNLSIARRNGAAASDAHGGLGD